MYSTGTLRIYTTASMATATRLIPRMTPTQNFTPTTPGL